MSGGTSGQSQSNQYTPQLTPQQLIDTYNQNLPQTLGITAAQAAPTAASIAGAAAGANPIYTASGLQQLNQYAPAYQQAGANLATQQAQTTTGLLQGAGGQAAQAAGALSNSLNPAQQAANTQATNLVNSINLNGLSGGEQAATERSLNQSNYATGNLGLDNATNAVSNAMNFGNALQAKRTALGSALGTATGVASNQNQFVNPVGTATAAGNTSSNFGLGTFAPNQGNSTANSALTFGQSIFAPTASNASASGGSGAGSGSSAQGGLCCFIFMEAYYGELPECVRLCRDRYYRVMPAVANGYTKMAAWLVPLMRHNRLVRWMVWHTMVRPLTEYGKFILRCGGNRRYRFARRFWFTIWNNI